jgi:hypothetical protein
MRVLRLHQFDAVRGAFRTHFFLASSGYIAEANLRMLIFGSEFAMARIRPSVLMISNVSVLW